MTTVSSANNCNGKWEFNTDILNGNCNGNANHGSVNGNNDGNNNLGSRNGNNDGNNNLGSRNGNNYENNNLGSGNGNNYGNVNFGNDYWNIENYNKNTENVNFNIGNVNIGNYNFNNDNLSNNNLAFNNGNNRDFNSCNRNGITLNLFSPRQCKKMVFVPFAETDTINCTVKASGFFYLSEFLIIFQSPIAIFYNYNVLIFRLAVVKFDFINGHAQLLRSCLKSVLIRLPMISDELPIVTFIFLPGYQLCKS